MNIYDAIEQAYKNGYQQGKRDAVKHGRWEYVGPNSQRCSHCKKIVPCGEIEVEVIQCGRFDMEYNYCPNCGAQMDLEETDG